MPETYSLTSHACRRCLSRILVLDGILIGGKPVYRCATCGAQGVGEPSSICGCGIRPKEGSANRPTGFRCMENAKKSPAAPADILIAFAGEAA